MLNDRSDACKNPRGEIHECVNFKFAISRFIEETFNEVNPEEREYLYKHKFIWTYLAPELQGTYNKFKNSEILKGLSFDLFMDEIAGELSKYSFEDISKDYKKRQEALLNILNDFEKRWGAIDDNYRTFCHFLLKYRYVDNWEREVIENYLPVSLETVKTKIPSNYSIEYEQDFIVPFIKDKVGKDFGVRITHSTHVKMVLKNNNFK